MEKRRITITLLRMLVLTVEMVAVMREARMMPVLTAEAAAMLMRTTETWLFWNKRGDKVVAIEMPDTITS